MAADLNAVGDWIYDFDASKASEFANQPEYLTNIPVSDMLPHAVLTKRDIYDGRADGYLYDDRDIKVHFMKFKQGDENQGPELIATEVVYENEKIPKYLKSKDDVFSYFGIDKRALVKSLVKLDCHNYQISFYFKGNHTTKIDMVLDTSED